MELIRERRIAENDVELRFRPFYKKLDRHKVAFNFSMTLTVIHHNLLVLISEHVYGESGFFFKECSGEFLGGFEGL